MRRSQPTRQRTAQEIQGRRRERRRLVRNESLHQHEATTPGLHRAHANLVDAVRLEYGEHGTAQLGNERRIGTTEQAIQRDPGHANRHRDEHAGDQQHQRRIDVGCVA